MRVIIAGGRDYVFNHLDIARLDKLHAENGFTLVITGGAKGADAEGEKWGRLRGIPTLKFPADWRSHGLSAGPIRNRQMIDSLPTPDMVVAFKGGKGTANIVDLALRKGITVVHLLSTQAASV